MGPDQIAEFLDQWSAGYVFLVLVGVWTIVAKAYKFFKGLNSHTEAQVTEKIKKGERIDGLSNDIETLKTELETITKDVEDYKKSIEVKLNQLSEQETSVDDTFLKSLAEIRSTLALIDPKLKLLEEKVSKVESQINVLITSDVEYIKAYITDSYNKFVKEKHHIDLISLQNVESVYNRLLQETGVEDEFLSKLMRELRNLPTTKDVTKDE